MPQRPQTSERSQLSSCRALQGQHAHPAHLCLPPISSMAAAFFLEEVEGSELFTNTQRAEWSRRSTPCASVHFTMAKLQQNQIHGRIASNSCSPSSNHQLNEPSWVPGRGRGPRVHCSWMAICVAGGHSWNPPKLIISFCEELRKHPFSSWHPPNEWVLMHFLFVHKNSGVVFFLFPYFFLL